MNLLQLIILAKVQIVGTIIVDDSVNLCHHSLEER